MRLRSYLLLFFTVAGLVARAADDANAPVLDPGEGEIAADSAFTLSFPDAMVKSEQINAGDVAWPVTIEPKAGAKFLWQSPTEGQLLMQGPITPGTHYRIATAAGLRDVKGRAVAKGNWEFDSPTFKVTCDTEERKSLSAQPRFELETNYPVAPTEVAEHAFFQDRESHRRFPVEVVVGANQSAERENDVSVTPREPLPMGRTYDLVVDGLGDLYAHKPLDYLRVFPAGTTKPLELHWLGAFNQALDVPMIRIKFGEKVDPDSLKEGLVKITPAVPKMSARAEEDEVVVEGEFSVKQRYEVEVGAQLLGIRGYPLEKAERWGATFHPKDPGIIFPGQEIFQRSARGLKFAFLQVNTGPAEWTLSQVPLARLPEISARIKAGYDDVEDPLGLTVVARGKTEANGAEEEVMRQIDWVGQPLSGPYVLEVRALGTGGLTVANRTVINFSEYVMTLKQTESAYLVRVAGMADARPVGGIKVRAISEESVELASAVTDKDGIARIPAQGLSQAKFFEAEGPSGPALQFVSAPRLGTSDGRSNEGPVMLRQLLVTDRNLYRPGQTVKIHGIARVEEGGQLRLPEEGKVHWQIKPASESAAVASGDATLSRHGSWEAEWNVPSTLQTGFYELVGNLGALKGKSVQFQVEEYRVPAFSVECEPIEQVGQSAQLKVSSAYFHGAPNGGAKVHWTATWMETGIGPENDQFTRFDLESEHHPEGDDEKETQGDAVLDAQGQGMLVSESPFKSGPPRGRFNVTWRVDVTSPEAQTLTGGAEQKVQTAAAWAGIKADGVDGDKPAVKVAVDAIDLDDKAVAGAEIKVELFHVRARTVKERIAPSITRYRNTREFEKVAERAVKSPASLDFPVKETGDYVATATGPGGVLVSARTLVSGEEEAELPVKNETEIGVTLPEPARTYRVGEVAPISVRAPFAGVAWVSVEAGEVLDTLLVPLAGNAGRIDLPVKKEYAPNATVSIYLLQPGGAKELPRERIGELKLRVARPESALSVETKLASAKVRPGAPVEGEVTVQSEGHPVEGAEFVVLAVDEAVLELGGWTMPAPGEVFFPERLHSVETRAALTNFVESIKRESLQQKGSVVGGGGEDFANVSVRKEFKTLAFWSAGLVTNAEGKIHFSFPAPDSLTEYRLVALGATDANQFGGGTTTFQISKPVLCEPALPRFARIGDQLMLRAVVRQTAAPKARLTVKCATEGMELEQKEPETQEAAKDVPAVFNFKARVADVSSTAKVRFEVSSDLGESDGVEISMPVEPPTVLRHESVGTSFTAAEFHPAQIAPVSWSKGRGDFNLTLSTSPWLPKLTGLPTILEYPHGCFEQISSRVLAYALMADLLQYLPDGSAREPHYREMLEQSMQRYQEALLQDGALPYWPGSEQPNWFVSVMAAWSLREAENAGITAPPALKQKLFAALDKIVTGQEARAGLLERCLALMVVADNHDAKAYGAVAEDLYLKRDRLTDEARAMLALAMDDLRIMPRETAQLLKEIAKPPAERAFDPRTFASTTRAEALTTLALARIAPDSPQLKPRRDRLDKLMDSAASLSTQENLWLLLAFKALHQAHPPSPIADPAFAPAPVLVSKNRTGVAWTNHDLAQLSAFAVTGLPGHAPLSALLTAEYRSSAPEQDRTDRGLRIERVVRNLTEPKRDGSTEAPFKLGDQLLVTYRLLSRNVQNYVALEDLLPAGLETVNPDLELVAKTYRLPAQEGIVLELSHSELRDKSTCLYFDRVEPGVASYSVLAHATTAGSFRWPATQAYPMYDSRFTGLSAASLCEIRE